MSWRGALVALALLCACPSAQAGDKSKPKPAAVKPNPAQTDVTAEDYPMPPLPTAKMQLKDSAGTWHPIEVEVAATPIARQRGLMWRRELEAGKGMLFIFPGEEDHYFWMRNTLIGLDMVFISKEKQVVGIVKDAVPQSLDSRGVGAAALYVLELPKGYTEKIGLRPGAAVQISGAEAIQVVP
jgi:uncharacterized protein